MDIRRAAGIAALSDNHGMRARLVALVLIAMEVASCAGRPPPQLGRNLPRAFAAARPVFNERVRARFPVGSGEQQMLVELQRQGFRVSADPANLATPTPYEHKATYESRNIACNIRWSVRWNSTAGKITADMGDFGASCL